MTKYKAVEEANKMAEEDMKLQREVFAKRQAAIKEVEQSLVNMGAVPAAAEVEFRCRYCGVVNLNPAAGVGDKGPWNSEAVKLAIENERERCAQVADSGVWAREIAAAIRALKDEP